MSPYRSKANLILLIVLSDKYDRAKVSNPEKLLCVSKSEKIVQMLSDTESRKPNRSQYRLDLLLPTLFA